MNNILNVRLQVVADAAKHYYFTHHRSLDFPSILKYLYKQGKLVSYPLRFHPVTQMLDSSDFLEHAYSQIIHADLVLSDVDPSIIQEENIIPVSKDVFTVVNLPFINPYIHFHNFFEIIYVYTGRGVLNFENETEDLIEGDLKIIAPHSLHSVWAGEDSLILSINIRTSTFNNVFSSLFETNTLLSSFFTNSLYGKYSRNYISFKIENRLEWQEIIQEIFNETNREDSFANKIAVYQMHVFFCKLLRDFGNTIHLYDNRMSYSSFNSDFPMMMRYVQENYSTVNLTVLSEIFHYSEIYISKMFKKNLNLPFSHALRDIRLRHAGMYLKNTDYKISEIAELVGYDSADYLSRAFKKKYGVSPCKYRDYYSES